tara:strand:+ start:3470 stop:4510 length:1041 start_codon:yes stop_codon:yes gene_type:complete
MFDKYKGKGLTGLANLGNTCFMNSVLQCLSHTYEFNDFLDTGKHEDLLNKKPESLILMEWDKLRKMMWSENCTISPGGFVLAIRKIARLKDKQLFTGYAQNDLTEFLNFLIECFHESLNREVDMDIKGDVKTNKDELAKKCYHTMKNMYESDYSEMLKFFYGMHVSTLSSLEGDKISDAPEPFMMLQLEIPVDKRRPSLYNCLDAYTKFETLDENNMYYNEDTNKREKVMKSIQFWNLPKILIVVLKRFICNGNRIKKNEINVDFDTNTLDLSKYVLGYNKKSYVYELYGVCNHSGGTMGGHYTSYVKNANNQWYHFNDTSCKKISDVAQIKSGRAYCFFYRKKNI